LPTARRSDPAIIKCVRNLAQRCRSRSFDLPNDRQDVGRVLIGCCLVGYDSGLVSRRAHLGEIRISKLHAPGLCRPPRMGVDSRALVDAGRVAGTLL
jgi:hypothetical protein